MPPTDGTIHRDVTSKESASAALEVSPPRDDYTPHQSHASCDLNNVRIVENNQGWPGDHPVNKPRGPIPPPKDSKCPTQPASVKTHISHWKKVVGVRDRDRPASKESHDPSNYIQHIQKQEGIIKHLENLLAERDNHICNLEGRINQQQKQLQEGEMIKQELSSIRQNLRLDDDDEPWIIAQNFSEINKKVEDISIKLSKVLCKTNARRALNTSDLFVQLIANRKGERKSPFSTSYPMEADEFIEFGCRSLLSRVLYNTVLSRKKFHPAWDHPANALCYDIFNIVRENEAQVNVGRWRISTFKTIPSDIKGYCEEMATSFCNMTLVPFCKTAYSTEVCVAAMQTVFSDIAALLSLAYAWHHRTRSTVLMLDFEVLYYPPGSPFSSHCARVGESEAKLPAPEFILLTSELGLVSSKVVGDGKREEVCQTKAVVLGNGYFKG